MIFPYLLVKSHEIPVSSIIFQYLKLHHHSPLRYPLDDVPWMMIPTAYFIPGVSRSQRAHFKSVDFGQHDEDVSYTPESDSDGASTVRRAGPGEWPWPTKSMKFPAGSPWNVAETMPFAPSLSHFCMFRGGLNHRYMGGHMGGSLFYPY